jgi:hypothetical protein
MSPKELLALWRTAAECLTTARMSGLWVEITLPLSTLSSKFVRVFVQTNDDGTFLLSDLCDLTEDSYEVGDDNRAFAAALDLTGRKVASGDCYCQSGAVFCRVPSEELLTSRLFDLAQLLQLSVNLAVLSLETGPVSEGALVVSQMPRRARGPGAPLQE